MLLSVVGGIDLFQQAPSTWPEWENQSYYSGHGGRRRTCSRPWIGLSDRLTLQPTCYLLVLELCITSTSGPVWTYWCATDSASIKESVTPKPGYCAYICKCRLPDCWTKVCCAEVVNELFCTVANLSLVWQSQLPVRITAHDTWCVYDA